MTVRKTKYGGISLPVSWKKIITRKWKLVQIKPLTYGLNSVYSMKLINSFWNQENKQQLAEQSQYSQFVCVSLLRSFL